MDFAQFIIDLLLFLVYTLALLLLFAWWVRFWKMYVNQRYNNSLNWLMLEIKLPREINKSPVAMEIALNSFLQGGGVSVWWNREFEGKLPTHFSLEIASLEGTVHFYIRAEKKFRNLIEANFYSQYPGIEISEVDDYTKKLRYEHHKPDQAATWGIRYKTSETWNPYPDIKNDKGEAKYKMPADFLPIKTYVDYGLDKDPKEEFKNDPITPLIEFLGSLGKGEYAWYQVMLQDSEGPFNNKKFPKTYIDPMTHKHINLAEMADMYKDSIRKKIKFKKGDTAKDKYGEVEQRVTKKEVKDKDGNVISKEEKENITYKEDVTETKTEQQLTQEEKDKIEAINRKLTKPLLRVVMRMVYVTQPSAFKPGNIQNLLSIMKPFSTGHFNKLGIETVDPYDFPWEDSFKRRKPWRNEEMFNAFVEREGFFPHIKKRPVLDKQEDIFFFPYKSYVRGTWRQLYEAIFHPFEHPENGDVCTLNLEEVATLWHFPGAVAQTPTLPRIDSTKGVAPVNLPM